jgi:ribose 1,5-bisphosphate isomerase
VNPTLISLIDRIAADRVSGASELMPLALEVLSSAADLEPQERREAALALCRAQPAMASIWSLAAVMLAEGPPGLERWKRRLSRAPRSIARVAEPLIALRPPAANETLKIRTLSFSGTVAICVEHLATRHPVEVCCGEGRPNFEGRRLAARLAERGVSVTLLSDAAAASGLEADETVLLGADVVTDAWFVNKCGSHALAATAEMAGAPVYILAARDKFLPAALAGRLPLAGGPPDEIWESPPAGVTVRNQYFERVPLRLASSVITEEGPLPAQGRDPISLASAHHRALETLLAGL